jgi:hypothetical protein
MRDASSEHPHVPYKWEAIAVYQSVFDIHQHCITRMTREPKGSSADGMARKAEQGQQILIPPEQPKEENVLFNKNARLFLKLQQTLSVELHPPNMNILFLVACMSSRCHSDMKIGETGLCMHTGLGRWGEAIGNCYRGLVLIWMFFCS